MELKGVKTGAERFEIVPAWQQMFTVEGNVSRKRLEVPSDVALEAWQKLMAEAGIGAGDEQKQDGRVNILQVSYNLDRG